MPEPTNSNSNELVAGGNPAGGGDTVGDAQSEPEYIYIESVGDDGEWSEQYRIDYETAKTLVTQANQEAGSESLAAVQGFASDYSSASMVSMTFLTVIVFAVCMVAGCVAVQTLIRSFEVRR